MDFELEGDMGQMLAKRQVGASEEAFGTRGGPDVASREVDRPAPKRAVEESVEDESPSAKEARECLAKSVHVFPDLWQRTGFTGAICIR